MKRKISVYHVLRKVMLWHRRTTSILGFEIGNMFIKSRMPQKFSKYSNRINKKEWQNKSVNSNDLSPRDIIYL